MNKFSKQIRFVYMLLLAVFMSLGYQNCSNKQFASEMGEKSLIPLEEITSVSKAEIQFLYTPERLVSITQETIPFTITDLDKSEKVVCRLNNIIIENCAEDSVASLQNLQDGFQIFTVEIYNKKDEKVKQRSLGWTVDTVAPEIAMNLAPSIISANTTEEIIFIARDANDPSPDARCKLDNLDWAPCTSTTLLESLSLGNHTFQIEVKDLLGNTSPIKILTWEVVDTIPSLEIVEKPLPASNNRSPKFVFRAVPTNRTDFSKYECKLNTESAFSECQATVQLENLDEGNYTFTVHAKNRGGTATPDLSYSFTVDATPPTLSSSIVGLINGDEVYENLFIQHTVNDNLGYRALQCKVNAATEFADCSSNTNFNSLGAGVHSIQIRAIDFAGLVSPVQSFQNVYYFKEKPNIQFKLHTVVLPEDKPEFADIEIVITGDNLKPLSFMVDELSLTYSQIPSGIATPRKGSVISRWDWDYNLYQGSSVSIPALQKTGVLKIQYSMDLRDEPDEKLTLGIPASANGQYSVTGTSGQTIIKIQDFNLAPAAGEITYSGLMIGVFNQNCIMCHNSDSLAGGWDISDYKGMVAKSIIKPGDVTPLNHKLYFRLFPQENNTKPMPLSGFMSNDKIELIEKWILSGAKNN